MNQPPGRASGLTVWATSAEVKASPFDQVMPSFKWNTQVARSSEASQLLAR